eukprot:19944-Amphidinium_carterae.1
MVPEAKIARFPTSKQAKTVLNKCVDTVEGRLLPKNSSRTSLRTEGAAYPRSITLGLTVGRGYGIAHQTPHFPELVPQLHKLGATRPSKEREPYLSVQIVRNTKHLVLMILRSSSGELCTI